MEQEEMASLSQLVQLARRSQLENLRAYLRSALERSASVYPGSWKHSSGSRMRLELAFLEIEVDLLIKAEMRGSYGR